MLAITGGHGCILEQRFLLPLFRGSSLFARHFWMLPLPRQSQSPPRCNSWMRPWGCPGQLRRRRWRRWPGAPGCEGRRARHAAAAGSLAGGGERQQMQAVKRSRCLISRSAVRQQPGNSPAARRGRPAARVRKMKLFECSLLLAPLRRPPYPSPPFPTPLSSACATAPRTLPPYSRRIPVATIPIYPPSVIPCCVEGEMRGEKGWEPNSDKFLPAPDKVGPRGRGSSFSGAVLGGQGRFGAEHVVPDLISPRAGYSSESHRSRA